MDTFISRSPEDTFQLGFRWAEELAPGWVIGLIGDLGSGKTQLVKGLARGLGIDDKITSPTFSIVNEYIEAAIPLYHLDLYRLNTERDVLSAGLESYLEPDGISVIEWYDRLGSLRARRTRVVHFKQLDENSRSISHEDLVS